MVLSLGERASGRAGIRTGRLFALLRIEGISTLVHNAVECSFYSIGVGFLTLLCILSIRRFYSRFQGKVV